MQGTPAPVPRYYKSLLKEVGTDLAFDMSARTASKVHENWIDAEETDARRADRFAVARSRVKVSKRDI